MTDSPNKKLKEALSSQLFATRDTVTEAYDQATATFDTFKAGDKAAAYIALHVFMNTLANEIK